MIRKNKTIHTVFLAFLTLTFLSYCGCKPEVPKTADKAVPTDKTSTDKAPTDKTISSDDSAAAGTTKEMTEETSSVDSQRKTEDVAVAPKSNAFETSEKGEASAEPGAIKGDLGSVDWDSMVGQQITIAGDLVVVDTHDLARRGQVKLARERIYVPTSQIDPNDADASATSFEGGSNVAKVVKRQKQNDAATITLDDGSSDQNVFPPKLFPNLGKTHPSVRVGSVLSGVTGKLVKQRKRFYLVPSAPLQWTPVTRPQRPDVGKADVTVSSFNVLNYFTTIDNGSNSARGADSQSEFRRQEAKIVAAIIELNSDVVGLMEIENNIEAEIQLVAALNKAIGSEVFKGCGIPDGFAETPGGNNAIRVGFIYRADRVTPVGDVSMIRDGAFDVARTPIVQTFKSKTAGKPFTVIVNHFKSKGGSKADAANRNKGDGQGAFNASRRAQSLAICDYINQLSQGDEQPRVLVVGDLNAYAQEDPIDAMRAKGLVDLQERFEMGSSNKGTSKGPHYSYIYRGQSGSLDHAMATESLAADVTGIGTWHINADEPRFLDYNEEFNPKSLFQPDPFRSSDHDPVLIGIRN